MTTRAEHRAEAERLAEESRAMHVGDSLRNEYLLRALIEAVLAISAPTDMPGTTSWRPPYA